MGLCENLILVFVASVPNAGGHVLVAAVSA